MKRYDIHGDFLHEVESLRGDYVLNSDVEQLQKDAREMAKAHIQYAKLNGYIFKHNNNCGCSLCETARRILKEEV